MSDSALWIVGLTLIILILGGLTLPSLIEFWIQARVRKKLRGLGDFEGRLEKLNLNFTRLGFEIHALQLDNQGNQLPEPFLRVASFTVELDWSQTLAYVRPMGRIWVRRAKINVVVSRNEDNDKAAEKAEKNDFEATVKRIFEGVSSFVPYPIDALVVEDAEVHVYDTYAATPIDIHVYDIDVWGKDFQRKHQPDNLLVASLDASMKTVGDGRLSFQSTFDPWNPQYTLKSKLLLMNMRLRALNPILRQVTTLDASTGLLEAYAELTIAQERVSGYVKPFIDQLVLTRKTERRPFIQSIIRQSLDLVIAGLENEDEESLATHIPIEGRLRGPDFGYLRSVATLIQHGFVERLVRDYNVKVDRKMVERLQREAKRLT